MPVTSSTITIVEGQIKPAEKKKGPNVPLIVGLTVSLVGAALLIAAFLIYKKVYLPRV